MECSGGICDARFTRVVYVRHRTYSGRPRITNSVTRGRTSKSHERQSPGKCSRPDPGRQGTGLRISLVAETHESLSWVSACRYAEYGTPMIPVADLNILRHQWPLSVVSGMSRKQTNYESLRHGCKRRFRGEHTGCCSTCRTVIKNDMARHFASFHLDSAQLWRCPVSWCTTWKGTPQDCVDHIRQKHSVPNSVKATNLGRLFPPWTVTRVVWRNEVACLRCID